MEGQTLYIKQPNGRYKVFGHHEQWAGDTMKPGQFRLTCCHESGSRRYSYDVTPDTAAFLAAAEIAAAAMEEAIRKAARATRIKSLREGSLSARQQEAQRKATAILREAGLLDPLWWQSTSDRDIAAAGIAAVKAAHELMD